MTWVLMPGTGSDDDAFSERTNARPAAAFTRVLAGCMISHVASDLHLGGPPGARWRGIPPPPAHRRAPVAWQLPAFHAAAFRRRESGGHESPAQATHTPSLSHEQSTR